MPTSPAVDKPQVALVGPTLPYHTGIAQYTSQLYDALGKVTEVQAYSFRRQYPGWLYPGKSGYKLTADLPPEPGINYTIDVYNPLSWRRTAEQIIASGCQVAILDWWTLFWQPGFTYVARRLKRKGVKVIFLCHNLFNHKTGGVMGAVDSIMGGAAEWMLRQADGYIVQSSEKKTQLEAFKPSADILFRLHPIYDRFPAPSQHLPKRGKLELLFFGLVRPYKGLDILLEALGRLQDRDVYLTIAGEPWGDLEALKKQIDDAKLPNLELHLEYVSDKDAANYFDRADVVVAPYRSATGSGVVAVAYHYRKPVIATAVGGLKDVIEDGKTGRLVAPEDSSALAEAIRTFTRAEAAAM
jgi:glycosyltransferase involved in cell wall biosynthesis